jgi:hypothetical protein
MRTRAAVFEANKRELKLHRDFAARHMSVTHREFIDRDVRKLF